MACAMLNSKELGKILWAEAKSIACYIINCVYMCPDMGKHLMRFDKVRKPSLVIFLSLGVLAIS